MNMDISFDTIASIMGLLLGGGSIGTLLTWRYQRNKAKAESMQANATLTKEIQDSYQRLTEDLKANLDTQQEYNEEQKQYIKEPAGTCAKYQITPSSSSDYIPEPSGSYTPFISSSITMPLSLYRLNDNLIGDSVRLSKLTEYPYLFQKRQELVSKFKVVSAPTIPYARKFSYLNKNWRMIAQEFHPWNDEVTLTMQSSPILND